MRACSSARAAARLCQVLERRGDEHLAIALGPRDRVVAAASSASRPSFCAVKPRQRRDVGERAVVRVNAYALVAEPDDECVTAAPPDALGVTQRAVRHDERHARDRIDRQVHPDRQARAHVGIGALRIRRARDEAEPIGELARSSRRTSSETRAGARGTSDTGCRCGTGRRCPSSRRSRWPASREIRSMSYSAGSDIGTRSGGVADGVDGVGADGLPLQAAMVSRTQARQVRGAMWGV